VLGKVFPLYLVLQLLLITVNFNAFLSGMNVKTVNIWKEISLGFVCLLHSAMLFHFCNSAHYLANIVRYQKNLFEKYIALSFILSFRMYVGSEVLNKIIPPYKEHEFSIPVDSHSLNRVRIVTKLSNALGKLQ
jgi:hypothetical protein